MSNKYLYKSDPEKFPSPFFDMASLDMPTNMQDVLKFCEAVAMASGTFRMAMERIVSYFLTPVEVGSASPSESLGSDEKDKWETYLDEDIGILATQKIMGLDRAFYGNSFGSVVIPFKRFLICPGCSMVAPLRVVYENPKFHFRFENYEFRARCPHCGANGKWDVYDEPDTRPEAIRIKRWSPHEMVIMCDPFTDDTAYFWNIPASYRRLIKEGKLYYLERASLPVIESIKRNKLFRFADDAIYHAKEPALAGIPVRGWGIPRLLVNFRQVWYVQVLHRYNEAIALDYVIPFRLLTPSAKNGSTAGSRDPLASVSMGDFSADVRQMLRRRRFDPTGWNMLPFPVEYQSLGGDATALAPQDLLNQGIDTLLNDTGTPVELYRGSLQVQSTPVAMRLFEATFQHLVHDNNAFLRWFVNRSADILGWERVTARHRKVMHADDAQRNMTLIQLMMGGAISETTGLRILGIDRRDEKQLSYQEARSDQEMEARMQEEMDRQAYGDQVATAQPQQPMAPGAMPPGGAPQGDPSQAGAQAAPMGMAGPVSSMSMPQTPEEMQQTAASLAQQLLGLPESVKDSELRALKQKNEFLHSLVKAEMEKIRSQARTQGGAMLMAQNFGGG